MGTARHYPKRCASDLTRASAYRIRSTMDLATWRKQQPTGALAGLADKTGLRWPTLYDIASGKRRPTVESAKLIELHTGGAVTVAEMLDLARPTPAKKRHRPAPKRKSKKTKRAEAA